MAGAAFPWSRRQLLASLAAGLASAGLAPARGDSSHPGEPWRWGVDYGPDTDPALAGHFQLLVLEPDHPRPLAPLQAPGRTLLGYLSLGEIEKGRPYVRELEVAGALMAANPDWPDARRVDLRHPAWGRILLDRVIPEILARGYHGIFIDTTDNAEALERANPVVNKGMVNAAAELILSMRKRFPGMPIMLNRGYAVTQRVAPAIDYLLGESMASRWNFAKREYELLSDSDWTWQADRLRAAQAINPALRLLTLDYWDPAATRQITALYARERAAGFLPYVSTLALDHLAVEPVR